MILTGQTMLKASNCPNGLWQNEEACRNVGITSCYTEFMTGVLKIFYELEFGKDPNANCAQFQR